MKEYKIRFKSYNKRYKNYARKMRTNGTNAEKRMRENVLKHRPLGYKFLRQKPIDSFIVDFYCSRLSLAIELDGEIHQKTKEYDLERDTKLYKKGINVVRYKNNDIMHNSDTTKEDIESLIEKIEQEIEKCKISPG